MIYFVNNFLRSHGVSLALFIFWTIVISFVIYGKFSNKKYETKSGKLLGNFVNNTTLCVILVSLGLGGISILGLIITTIFPVTYDSIPTIEKANKVAIFDNADIPLYTFAGEDGFNEYDYGDHYTVSNDFPVHVTKDSKKYHYFDTCYVIKNTDIKTIKHIDAFKYLKRDVCKICLDILDRNM